jgi:protein SCO1/2
MKVRGLGRRAVVTAALGAAVAAGAIVVWRVGWHPPSGSSGSAATAPSFDGPNDLRSLADQEGKRFSFGQLRRHTVVMSFIFTHCPTSCPLQTKALAAVQRALPGSMQGRVQFLSVTMDPARDTPAVLKRYAAALGADLGNWSFVTGADDEITWLHRHYNAQVKRTDGGQFDHRVAVYLLDANGNLIQTYTGDFDQLRLIKEIGEVDNLYNKA